MWVCLSGAFLSIVANRDDPETLLVRARKERHIESAFPKANVFTMRNADYFYRAIVPRQEVAEMLSKQAMTLTYGNFKSSVKDSVLHTAYMDVWSVFRRAYSMVPKEYRRA